MRSRINVGTAEFETFLLIAEMGSFSKAAERLSLSQPSISNRIQRLETAVRTRLFERTTRAVVLTPAGERLRLKVTPIIRSFQALIDEFCTEADTRGQTVVVATTTMLATVLFPPIISRFLKVNPSIEVDVRDQISGQTGSDLRSGRVDFAVLAKRRPLEGIEFSTIVKDRFMVVGPRGHPGLESGVAGIEILAQHPLLLLTVYRTLFRTLSESASSKDLILGPVRNVANMTPLLGFVAEGLGLTVLPRLILKIGGVIDDTRFDVAELGEITVSREFGIASLPGRRMSPAANILASAIRSELLAHASMEYKPRKK